MAQKIGLKHFQPTINLLWNFSRKHHRDALILLVAGILSALGNGLVPYISGRIFDAILDVNQSIYIFGYQLSIFYFLLSVLIITQIITALVDRLSSLTNSRFGFFLRFDYQAYAYGKLLKLPMAFHKKRKVGGITSKIEQAGHGLEVISYQLLGGILPRFLTVVIAVILLFTINQDLAVITLAIIAIFIATSYSVIEDSGRLHKKMMAGWSKSFDDIYDAVYNIPTIKQSATEEYEQRRFYKTFSKNIFPFWYGLDKVWQTLHLRQRLGIILLQIIIFVWSAHLVQTGVMTIGQLIAFNGYLALLFGPFVSLLDFWRIFQNALINIYGVEKIITLPAENYHPAGSKNNPPIQGNIKFEHVYYKYEKSKEVLKDINFSVQSGQTVALVGESGVGKSTLIDLISGYNFPNQGKVLIDGINIKKINLVDLRSKIAVVPQEVSLFNDTIKKNIIYGNFKASQSEIIQAAKKAHAYDFIQKFPRKWDQVVGERGVKLSVGQKQRVAIARAILRDPAILVLDEPTSALDAKTEKIIQESLNTLMTGRTTFIIAHRLSTARKADLILVIDDGRIVEQGKHDELIKKDKGIYRHLYELQIGLHQ